MNFVRENLAVILAALGAAAAVGAQQIEIQNLKDAQIQQITIQAQQMELREQSARVDERTKAMDERLERMEDMIQRVLNSTE